MGRPLVVAPPRQRRMQQQAAAATAAPPSSGSSSSEASSSGLTLEVADEYSGDAFADLVRMAQAADPSLPSPAAAAACSSAGPPPEALPLSNKPYWLRQRGAQGERYEYLKQQMGGLRLATVCEEAQCPNIGECWNGGSEGIGTATIMLLGDTCTRGCRFCAVNTSQAPPPPDPLEPEHTAQVGGCWRVLAGAGWFVLLAGMLLLVGYKCVQMVHMWLAPTFSRYCAADGDGAAAPRLV